MGEIVRPVASSLAESLRAFGYSFETAVADIIDNSLYADAKNIWLDFFWSGSKTYFSITDDGRGMNSSELTEAMRPGSKSPLEERENKDLGRFGLGLKTASFSQCRKLIVCSKRDNELNVRCWDLNLINEKKEWYLLDSDEMHDIDKYKKPLENLNSGSVVFWESIDRVCGDLAPSSTKHHEKFLDVMSSLEFHLGMTFHRFLSRPNGPKFFLNGNKIQVWDPFMSDHDATQEKPTERINYKGNNIKATIFILPHHSKLTEADYKSGQGIRGWNDHQGFYVYRNKRLLIAGDWLGVGGAKEEHAKLARIRIDLPNTLDIDWHIDVKKSKASPPPILREELKKIASKARGEATSIYRHRGKIIKRAAASDDIVIVWKRIKRHGKYYFKLNQDYPLIKNILAVLPSGTKKDFRALIRLIGETIPTPAIAVTHSEEPDTIGRPFNGCEGELKKLGLDLYHQFRQAGISRKQSLRNLTSIEPFDSYPELMDILEQETSGAG